MSKVNRNSYDHYSIWTAADAEGTPNHGYPKSWFYFEAGGFINRKITFSIHRVHFLWSVVNFYFNLSQKEQISIDLSLKLFMKTNNHHGKDYHIR